ncbi:hypothetical protein F4778DRAFT_265914 [Xylariomycetidae sp. FL2044]|nr:hypothetical protein F4778DRAFT_265914 [Xylariomycetidae sp. FL2044]
MSTTISTPPPPYAMRPDHDDRDSLLARILLPPNSPAAADDDDSDDRSSLLSWMPSNSSDDDNDDDDRANLLSRMPSSSGTVLEVRDWFYEAAEARRARPEDLEIIDELRLNGADLWRAEGRKVEAYLIDAGWYYEIGHWNVMARLLAADVADARQANREAKLDFFFFDIMPKFFIVVSSAIIVYKVISKLIEVMDWLTT